MHMTESPPSCGALLRALRQSVPVSMSAVAEAAKCSYGHYRMIEEGYRRPSPELAQNIANALSGFAGRTVTVAEFYDRTTPRRAA